jgi:hypothetical protein
MRYLLTALLLISFTSCDSQNEKKSSEPNVLKSYVKTPIDRAKGARNRVEDRQDETEKQMKQLKDLGDE